MVKVEVCLACSGPMYQAGTLSGNPLAMVAGIKTLEILDRPGAYEHLDAVTGKLIEGLLQAGRDAGHEVCGGHISGEMSAQKTSSPFAVHCMPVRGCQTCRSACHMLINEAEVSAHVSIISFM